LTASEESYYRQKLPKPPQLPKGFLLVTRWPMSQCVKVTYHTGESKVFSVTPMLHKELVEAGVPEEKLVTILDYVWNFIHCITQDKSDYAS